MKTARVGFVVALVACQAAVAAAAPGIARIQPPAGKQGTTVEIRMTGTDLDDPRELFFEEGRITVTALVAESDAVVKATLAIPADCPPGPQRLRVRTAEGLSELRMFHVHAADQVEEKEPNDLRDTAMPIQPGTSVWGTLRNEDVDTFAVHLQAGARISAVVEAVRLDQQMLDPHLELVDAQGFVIASCDDHPLLAQDAALTATVQHAGDYFLRVRESAYGGGDGVYLVHVGDFPIPHVAWPPGGPAGGMLDVEWRGDPSGPFRQPVTLPAAAGVDSLARVWPIRDGRVSPLAVPFRITASPIVQVGEPSNQPGEAATASAPTAIVGRIDDEADVDWIRVAAPKGSAWKVTGWGRRLGSPIDLVINAHRADDKREKITGNDDADGPDSVLNVTTPDEGAFLLRVSDFQRRGGADFIYWIDVEPVVPMVTVSVPPAQTKTQQRLVAAVPRGNRTALAFNAARAGCSDPVVLAFSDLPAGVTALSAPFLEPAPGGIVVFEAAADAAPGTARAGVQVIRGAGEAATPIGTLRQETDLVFGEPNRTTYRTALSDRLTVAVVDEAPVSIELEPPATPIARRGLLELRVKVIRAEGFEGRVRLELPFKPPGIGASTVEVKEGETEIRFPINAAADAPAKDWQIAIAASLTPAGDNQKENKKARRAGRGMWIASRPVTLSVIEPLVELAADKAVVEQGAEAKLVFKATRPGTFQGSAKVSLVGLPLKTEAPTLAFEAGDATVEFPVRVAADAPVGKHDNIFCRIEMPHGEKSVIFDTASTSLRIDKPIPPEHGKEGGS